MVPGFDVVAILLAAIQPLLDVFQGTAPKVIGVAVAVFALIFGWRLVNQFTGDSSKDDPDYWR